MTKYIEVYIVGTAEVGKTRLYHRFFHAQAPISPYKPTQEITRHFKKVVNISKPWGNIHIIPNDVPASFNSRVDYHYACAIILMVSPIIGESELNFIKRVHQQVNELKQEINNDSKPILLTLSKTDLLAPDKTNLIINDLSALAQLLNIYPQVFAIHSKSNDIECAQPILAAAKVAYKNRMYAVVQSTHLLSKFSGVLIALTVGSIKIIIVNNPLAVFFSLLRRFLMNQVKFIAVPLFPFISIYQIVEEIWGSLKDGWKGGITEAITPSSNFLKSSDIIFGLLVSLMVTGVVLSVVFPPASLALPSIIATLGLTSVSMGLLATLVGIATFLISASLYVLGSKLYDNLIISQIPKLDFNKLSDEPLIVKPATSVTAQPVSTTVAIPNEIPGGEKVSANPITEAGKAAELRTAAKAKSKQGTAPECGMVQFAP